jgi:hypothetical protein
MKFKTVILLLIVSVYGESYGQTNDDWTIYGTLGRRSISVNQANLYLYFIDDSPSMDNITTSVSIAESNLSVDLTGGFIKKIKNRYTWFTELDLIIGKVRGWELETGIGYELSVGEGRFIPNMNIGLMGTTKYLGDISNNDIYIQFDDVKMYSDIAKVYYKNTFFTLKPRLSYISKSISANNLKIIANIGYNMAFNGVPSLSFRGTDENDEAVTGYKSLASNNIKRFEINGIHTTSTIIDGSGLILNLGLVLNL